MNRRSWQLLLASASNNRSYVAAYALLDCLIVVSAAAFSVAIAAYFGHDVFGLGRRLSSLGFADGPTIITLAAILATVVLLARVLQGFVEARVTVQLELWLARRIRQYAARENFDAVNGPRASNYFGRLSAASMKALSGITMLILGIVVVPIILPAPWSIAVLFAFLVVAATLILLVQVLSRHMHNSSSDMAEHGKAFALWKLNPETCEGEEVDRFAAAYFRRIFLSSIFGYLPLLFTAIFSLLLLASDLLGHRIGLGEVFVAFVVAQVCLGLLTRAYSNLVKSAAFMPALADVPWNVLTGDETVRALAEHDNTHRGIASAKAGVSVDQPKMAQS